MLVLMLAAAFLTWAPPSTIAQTSGTAFGIDVDFYTGPISREVWAQIKDAGQRFVVAQAWGGRSRNELAVSQLAGGARSAGLQTAAYILLNYDNKVCPTFAHPVRERGGKCAGTPILQKKHGGRWQVRQGLAALGSELRHVRFVAVDVEWFLSGPPSAAAPEQARRRQSILDAIDEVKRSGKKAVIYTRNAKGHWRDITGCDANSPDVTCAALSRMINDSGNRVRLWDVETGSGELDNFQPYAHWNERAGRQFQLDANLFGLPASRTVDLNVFDASLFSGITNTMMSKRNLAIVIA
jgi:hypothetical protein